MLPLLHQTGYAHVDELLNIAVIALDAALGHRVRGYYLVGSYAMNCPIATSDIDLVALCCDTAMPAEREQLVQLVRELRASYSLSLDITLIDEDDLQRNGATRFKFASVLLAGADVRDSLPMRSLNVYARSEMAGGMKAILRTRKNAAILDMPLLAPDPQDEFLGYAARRMKLADGSEQASTKDLVNATVLIGTALVAAEARQYVHHKSQLTAAYRAFIGDEWADHVETVYALCRMRWEYGVPVTFNERQQLRGICKRELAFENAFVPRYLAFWQCEDGSEAQAVRDWAQRQLAIFANNV